MVVQQNCDTTADYLVKYVRWACESDVEVRAAIEVGGGTAQLADKLRQRGQQLEKSLEGDSVATQLLAQPGVGLVTAATLLAAR